MTSLQAFEFGIIVVRTAVEGLILWLIWKRMDAIMRAVAKSIKITWTPVVIDGTLYVSIAVFLATQTFFTTDEAYRYVNPYVIFWIKAVSGILGAGAGALKMFRDQSYAKHRQSQDEKDSQNSPLPNPPVGTTPSQPPASPDQPKVNP